MTTSMRAENRASPVVLKRALQLLDAIVKDCGQSSISSIGARIGLSPATGYRLAGALVEHGIIVSCDRGRYCPGNVILSAAVDIDRKTTLTRVSKACLPQVARKLDAVAHVAVLEDGMVSYLSKVGATHCARFTVEGTQLDPHCTGLGKLLLAHLPPTERNVFLAEGPFPKLTDRTFSEPADLASHFEEIRRRGYSIDDREFHDDLQCVAVPIRDRDGTVWAAISASGRAGSIIGARTGATLEVLRHAAATIETCMYGPSHVHSAVEYQDEAA